MKSEGSGYGPGQGADVIVTGDGRREGWPQALEMVGAALPDFVATADDAPRRASEGARPRAGHRRAMLGTLVLSCSFSSARSGPFQGRLRAARAVPAHFSLSQFCSFCFASVGPVGVNAASSQSAASIEGRPPLPGAGQTDGQSAHVYGGSATCRPRTRLPGPRPRSAPAGVASRGPV